MRWPASIAALFFAAPILAAQTEADLKILEMADLIEERVAEIRGREFKRSVEKGVYDREQLEEFIRGALDEELPEEKAAAWGAALEIFGLIPEGLDLRKTFADFLASQVGGFYDPDTKRLYCISSKLALLNHIVMAHEILHSLQDQYVDLNGYMEQAEFNDDLLAARQAVIEGEAQHMTTEYAAAHPFAIAADAAGMRAADVGLFAVEQLLALQGAPPYFVEIMTFPYLDGERFIKAAREEGGWRMVDILYLAPPHSSEQILHPEKFFGEADEPARIVLAELPAAFRERCEKVYENTLGELQVRVLVKLTADPIRAQRAAAGWDGDTYAVFRERDTGRAFMIWALAFDTPEDAEEFVEAEGKGLGRKYAARREGDGAGGEALIPGGVEAKDGAAFFAGGGRFALVERRDADVVVLDNVPLDAEGAGELLESAWGFRKEEFDFRSLRPLSRPEPLPAAEEESDEQHK